MALPHTLKLASAILICSALAALGLSSSVGAAAPGPETFEGSCEMSGVIRNQPPLTQSPKPTTFHGSFSGVCSGELTDRHGRTEVLTDAAARYDGRGAGELSCPGGISTGTGRLLFRGGTAIDVTLTERRGPGVAFVTLDGKAGGTGTVLGTVSQDEDLAEINERCNGSGLRFIRGDARIASPGISG